jgi:hypothetical protein
VVARDRRARGSELERAAKTAHHISAMSNKADDSQHFHECHERWVKKGNRPISQDDTPEAWVETQCMTCAYYLQLPGKFAFDWGVCSNPKSPMDGKVTFEHDGCDFFVFDDDYFRRER